MGAPIDSCTTSEQTSGSITDGQGVTISGGRCIPGTRIPATAEFSFHYEPLCQPNVDDACGPRVCDTAEAPARIFAVTRTTLATGAVEQMGGGCYSTKHDPPKVTPADVLAKLKTVPIPVATITVQPPGGRTLVNFDTIVSSDAKAYEKDVKVLGQDVHLWITPTTWTWDFGDGSDPLVRSDAGVAWEEGVTMSQITEDKYTLHEYLAAEDFEIGLAVTWTADYQVGTDPAQSVPGSVDISSESVPIEVVEAVPQLVK